MNAIHYLVWANVAIWAGMGCYIIFLAAGQKRLQKRISHLEQNSGQ